MTLHLENVAPENKVGSQGVRGAGKNDSTSMAGGTAAQPSRAMRSAQGGFAAGGPRAMVMVQKADIKVALNTTQTFKLSLTPQQDFQFAQLRLTLPDGLQFVEAEGKDQPEKKAENFRIIWRGAAQKNTLIESEIGLKATTNGFKNVMLTLESIDGQKLQTKDIVFQVQEPQPAAKPTTPPVETTN